MKTEHADLLQRLEKFSLDCSDASFPFSSRLAKENRWSLAYSHRVIEEYKRFVFLAVAAGHPVSPSESVDEAWHLHLTYSQSYWKEFCPQVLRMPLHHQPTKGGLVEKVKFEDWYAGTLQSYRTFFGEPPADIWPSPAKKAAQRNHFVRVDLEKNWVLPKIHFTRTRRNLAVACIALFGVVGCGAIVADTSNPLNMRGPEFLKWYFWLSVICFAIATWVRWKLRKPSDMPVEDSSNLDAYSAAFLNKGKILAVNSAIASLIERKIIKADAKERRLFVRQELPLDAHPLERAVHTFANGELIADARAAAKPVVTAMMEQLQRHGLLMDETQIRKVRFTALSIALIPVVMGLIKICVGLSRGKPVMFLIIACILTTVVALVAFIRKPHRSRRGDFVLKKLREKNRNLEHLKLDTTSLDPAYIAMGMGLFGMGALAGTPLSDLRKTLQPPPSVGSSSSGCGSSCGSSCGSGCGGGGGGGCGGCGGS